MPTSPAILGGGCFWCLDAVFRQIQGVTGVECGYTGGQVQNPGYRAVCQGTTGHAEVVKISYDASRISYRDLLGIFFALHDPTTLNRQGNDIGPQYRSSIFIQDDDQLAIAKSVIAELTSAQTFANPIVTTLETAGPYYPAEPYHQNYFAHNPEQAYCAAVVAPKVAKMRQRFLSRWYINPD